MTQLSNSDKAIAILEATQDGDLLSPTDLHLVEIAANNRLSDRGQELFDTLYQNVSSGDYTNPQSSAYPWFHGIQHLSRDHEGYVYWKGKHVEHYSYQNREEECAAAHRLAARCRMLESKGFPVNSRTAISDMFEQVPADTPWLRALTRFHTFFDKGDGKAIGVFYRNCAENEQLPVVSAFKEDGEVKSVLHVGAYEAFHAIQSETIRSTSPHDTYEHVLAMLQKTGLSPAEVNHLIGEPV